MLMIVRSWRGEVMWVVRMLGLLEGAVESRAKENDFFFLRMPVASPFSFEEWCKNFHVYFRERRGIIGESFVRWVSCSVMKFGELFSRKLFRTSVLRFALVAMPFMLREVRVKEMGSGSVVSGLRRSTVREEGEAEV